MIPPRGTEIATKIRNRLVTDADAVSDQPRFREVAAPAGLEFRHVNGAAGRYHLPEIMGAGGALFDYDMDGDLDVLLLQGRALEGHGPAVGGHGALGATHGGEELDPLRNVPAELGPEGSGGLGTARRAEAAHEALRHDPAQRGGELRDRQLPTQ